MLCTAKLSEWRHHCHNGSLDLNTTHNPRASAVLKPFLSLSSSFSSFFLSLLVRAFLAASQQRSWSSSLTSQIRSSSCWDPCSRPRTRELTHQVWPPLAIVSIDVLPVALWCLTRFSLVQSTQVCWATVQTWALWTTWTCTCRCPWTVATRPTTHRGGFALITPLPLTTTGRRSAPVEGRAWWGRRRAKAEETTATTGETSPCEEDLLGEVTSTGEDEGVEQSQASEAEGGEDPEEDTTTWTVCGTG